jgi:predicted amidohydrolase
MAKQIRLGCWQGPVGARETAEALDALAQAARQAAASDVDLLVAPEMCLTGYAIGADTVRRRSEPLGGPLHTAASDIARETGVGLVVGFPEKSGASIFNTVALIGKDGRSISTYRKTHLFGEVDRAQYEPGPTVPPVVDFDGVRIGLLICYDVEFPETVRAVALAGAEVVLVPTALMHPFDIVARTIVVARAFENQVYLAYANRCDKEDPFDYCGLSCIVGPDGVELARAGDGSEMIIADLATGTLPDFRREATHLMDRRPELYDALVRPKK